MDWLRYAPDTTTDDLPPRRELFARLGFWLLFIAFTAHTVSYALTWADVIGFPWSIRSRICAGLMLISGFAALLSIFLNLARKGRSRWTLVSLSLVWFVMLFLVDTELILAM